MAIPLLLPALLAAPLALADGVDSHGTSYNELLVGGGAVSEGMGFARRYGSPALGTFTVSGVPANARVRSALLYWVMTGAQDPTVIINDMEFTGAHIGTTDDTCWGYGDNYVFRAQVDAKVNGNGTYTITGFDYVYDAVDNQGFSIVVLYDQPGSPQITRVVINDGAIWAPLYPPTVSTATFPAIGNNVSLVRVHYLVGDTQGAPDSGTTFNGVQIAYDNFEGMDGVGGDGGMWDDDTFDITGLGLVQPGATTVWATIGDPPDYCNDCLAWTAFITEITYDNPCPDLDVDEWTTCDGDCDDANASVYPYAPELDDNLDNDCDTFIDEGLGDTDDTDDPDDTDDDTDGGGDDSGADTGGGSWGSMTACNCGSADAPAGGLGALIGLAGLLAARRRSRRAR